MARKRKKDIEAEAPEVEEQAGGVGHNSGELTEEQRMALFFQHKKSYEAALAIKKDADAKFKNVCKLAKSELGKEAVAEIKDAILLESDEGDAEFRARMERQMRVARYMGASYGTQFDMFDTSAVPATERAEQEGKRAAMEGKFCQSPYDPSLPQHDAWTTGWQAGQAALFNIQRSKDAELFEDAPEPAADLPPELGAAEEEAESELEPA